MANMSLPIAVVRRHVLPSEPAEVTSGTSIRSALRNGVKGEHLFTLT
jgi:hypothetical protein